MDRRGTRTRFLTAAAAALLLLPAATADPPLRAARWLAPGVPITVLARQPHECLAVPRNPAEAELVAIGRAAFRTPLLLGGQAARAGLSCSACHRNGRNNPHFVFPGLSGAPGTADITSSLMSAHRGDGVVNPRPIPDLAGPEAKRIVSRDPAAKALESFIHGLVTEEFDGPEPSPRTLAGLAAYVRALSPAACRPGDEPVTLATLLSDTKQAVASAAAALRRDDRPTARLMLSSARSTLGLIDERYTALPSARAAIRAADAELAAIQQALDAGANTGVRLSAFDADLPALSRQLAREEKRSLFNSALLAKAGR